MKKKAKPQIFRQFSSYCKSLKFKMTSVVFSVLIVLTSLLVFYNIYSIHAVRTNQFDTGTSMMNMYMRLIDGNFTKVEKYWVGLLYSSKMIQMTSPKSEAGYYSAQEQLKSDMETVVQSYPYIEDIFVFDASHDEYFDAANYQLSSSRRNLIKEMVLEKVSLAREKGHVEKNWNYCTLSDGVYLYRILENKSVFIGGCVSVSRLVEQMKADGLTRMDDLGFCSSDGTAFSPELASWKMQFRVSDTAVNKTLRHNGSDYLMISVPSASGPYAMLAVIKDNSILTGLSYLQNFLWILIAALVLFMISFVLRIRRLVLIPMQQLMDAVSRIRSGNFDVHFTDKNSSDDFCEISTNFESMASEIQRLRIDVYEAKVARQETELQYLKLQINPHFIINCLNVINNLALMNKNSLVSDMSRYLGNHLRYTMEESSVDLLKKEMACVQNYLEIQKLRFGDCIRAHISMEEDFSGVMIPPLIIQTFIENTVKYQVVAGEITEIFISVRREPAPREHYIAIDIRDTGEGFSDHILQCIKENRKIVDQRGEHYGIQNVKQRLKLIYHDSAKITISNHPSTGGAFIQMEIPEDIQWIAPQNTEEEHHSEGGRN